MRTRFIAAVAALVVGLFVSALHAETSTIARAGNWEAFGGTTTKGRGVCGVSQTTGDGKYFGVKWFSGYDTFTLQLGWKEWNIEDGSKQDIVMIMDSNPPWRATATGFHFEDKDAGLEFTINKSEIDNFTREFRTSAALRMQYPGGNATDWVISLAGTGAVSDALQNCLRKL